MDTSINRHRLEEYNGAYTNSLSPAAVNSETLLPGEFAAQYDVVRLSSIDDTHKKRDEVNTETDGKRILIAEDCPVMVRLLHGFLETGDVHVVAVADNGADAVQLYKRTKPDLVIMDLYMPKMNGLMATKLIVDFDPDAKIIICSVELDRQIIMKAMKLGAIDFIAKPVQTNRLLQVVKELLSK